MAEGEKIERMMELQKLLPPDFKFQAVTPGRMLVREGELAKMCRKGLQQRIVVLFTDCLLYCHEEYRRPTKVSVRRVFCTCDAGHIYRDRSRFAAQHGCLRRLLVNVQVTSPISKLMYT